MGDVRFGVDDLGRLRFAVSPLWETVAALRAAADPGGHALHLPWLKRVLTLPRPVEALDAAVPAPRCPLAEVEEELAAYEGPAATARALTDWWRAAVRPHWPRIRAVLEADLAHRTRQLSEDGIQEVLTGLHPGLRRTGDRLSSPDLPAGELALDGGGITLAPSVFATRCVLLPGRPGTPPCLVYPARAVGTLWERGGDGGDGLARLLGRSRAGLLAGTSAPATTTALAARSGLTPGAVSQHLTVLRDAGLVTGHRYRREVYYRASELGLALLAGAGTAGPTGTTGAVGAVGAVGSAEAVETARG
ncbi:ArsR/SmtB family transcription factor [Streptomyces showdoensis]|uniref:ArsR family transcriptional regulator n=1 Tax=Streptomyces showdoensis TaxID=68268 RepID=A0A2P2GD43_STREW|nr:DUF5937 family protein [Streptomyces showdoensis]KKZ69420.1 ArsR family transcriptional regulator [Streptomyces showdoensis]